LKLSFNPRQGRFVLRVPRSQGDQVQSLMHDHGLDMSVTASTEGEAVLFTGTPFAAVAFFDVADAQAREQLAPIHREIEASRAPSSKRHIDVPFGKELWPYQVANMDYALARKNVLIADEPGLGKTMQAIAIANEMQAERVLVICPATIRLQWVAKIQEWSTMRWPYVIHPILTGRNGVNPRAQWTVVSYDLARTEGIGRALASGTYDLLILDEAHYLKTIDAARTRAVFGGGEEQLNEPLAGQSSRVVALTGTPLPNRPRECYTLARNLCWDALDWYSEERFTQRFNPSRMGQTDDGRVFVDERVGRTFELQARLRTYFMCRHLKREVLPQLKMPVYDLIQLEETKAVKQALAVERLLDIDPETLEGADMTVLGHIAEARRLMGEALAPQIVEHVRMLLDGGATKLVLFAWHLSVLDTLSDGLRHYGLVRVDGKTSASQKLERVNRFRKDPAVRLIIGNTLSLGTGTDGLQEVSNHALICEPDWVPGNNIQAFDRLDRGGQTRVVQGDIFVAPNSIAEKVLASALRKLQTTHKALDARVKV
jgi:SNF2 family DNA or RNA helicase